eukprot:1143601-Pelagomonas_calceolata.AAC.2
MSAPEAMRGMWEGEACPCCCCCSCRCWCRCCCHPGCRWWAPWNASSGGCAARSCPSPLQSDVCRSATAGSQSSSSSMPLPLKRVTPTPCSSACSGLVRTAVKERER